jgi:hypothetical protein
MGNQEALRVYADILGRSLLPQRSNGGGIAPPPGLQRSMTMGIQIPPITVTTFEDLPMSLPAPRARDIQNETPKERLKADLATLRGDIQSKLILVMDSRRRAVSLPEDERDDFLEEVHAKENILWAKLDAVDLLLKN